ncbi:hypothetical protein ACT7C1_04215 [Bacillus paranthracis]
MFIFFGSILGAYACIGLLLIPFYHASLSTIAKWLGGISSAYLVCIVIQLVNIENEMVTSIVTFVTTDSTLILLMFLAGFGISKAGWIRRIGEFKKTNYENSIGDVTVSHWWCCLDLASI